MPRHEYDEPYEDEDMYGGHREYEDRHDDSYRRGNRAPTPPRPATRRDRGREARSPSSERTRSGAAAAPSITLSESTSVTTRASDQNTRLGNGYYTRGYRKGYTQSDVSDITATRTDVSSQPRTDAATSLADSTTTGATPDTRFNYTGPPPIYHPPPRKETREQRALRTDKRLESEPGFDASQSEWEEWQDVSGSRSYRAGMQADGKLERRARGEEWDDGVSGNRLAQMALDHDGRVDRRDHAPNAKYGYDPPRGAKKGDDPWKGKFHRVDESPPDLARKYTLPVDEFPDESSRKGRKGK